MAELTAGAGFVRGLMQLAVAKGANEAELAQRSQIDPKDLEDQDNRIPFAKYVALMKAGQELCRDPALALHYGESVDVSEFSIVGLIGLASPTMADAFVQLNRFVPLIVEVEGVGPGADRFVHTRLGSDLWLVDRRGNPNAFPELTESTFAHIVCGTRQFGDSPYALAVHVTYPKPQHHAEYDRIFGVPIVFDSDKNALLIDEAWRNYRIARSPRYVFGILSQHAEALLKSLETSKSIRGRVERLLMPILHTGDVSIDSIAAQLGLSRSTLFRKLKAEGVTFEKVLDELRHRLAVDYLKGKRVSVGETAYLVGFSDPAAFSRAFKRWTGSNPRSLRSSRNV